MDAAAPTFRRFALLLAASLIAAGALALVGDRGTAPAAAAESSPSIGALRICSTCAATGGDLSRYRYVVLHSWESGRIAALKAANPNVKVLVYKELPGTYDYACHNGVDDQQLAAGVGYCAANQQHPDWFLTDTTGSRIQFCDYQGIWQMDPGNAAYQDAWFSNVSADMKAHGWDGVMLDDANSTEKYHLCGRTIAKYPTEASYEAATRSFLARVGPALMGQGFLVLPNINFDCWETCWSSFIQYTSGASREWWTKSTNGTRRPVRRRELGPGRQLPPDHAERQQDLPGDHVCAEQRRALAALCPRELPARLERRPERAHLRARRGRSVVGRVDDGHRHSEGRALPGGRSVAA